MHNVILIRSRLMNHILEKRLKTNLEKTCSFPEMLKVEGGRAANETNQRGVSQWRSKQ
jgi:hypothetical protein